MLKVGLTGNIGSGKTTVSKIFEIIGVRIYHSDAESKRFLANPKVINRIKQSFPGDVFKTADEIDKTTLAKIVFSQPEALQLLNSILHPLVMEDFRRWCAPLANEPYIINEAAIIFESGYQDHFDRIIHISCPEEAAIERVIARDRVSREDILKRMNFQMKDEKKAAISDFVILNDGSELVIPQVLRIHEQLLQSSA